MEQDSTVEKSQFGRWKQVTTLHGTSEGALPSSNPEKLGNNRMFSHSVLQN